jgi:hypothetical protein
LTATQIKQASEKISHCCRMAWLSLCDAEEIITIWHGLIDHLVGASILIEVLLLWSISEDHHDKSS